MRDHVKRIVKTKYGKCDYISVPRFVCPECREIHRHLPDDILPYIHYEKEIVSGVLEGWITSDTLGFEDYPCEMTMLRWRTSRKIHREL